VSPVVLLLAGAVSSCAVDVEPAPIQVGLYADFQVEPSPEVRQVIRDQLATVLTPQGIAVSWPSAPDGIADPPWNRIATIEFRGRCDAADLWRRPPHPWVFGQTHVVHGQVLPYADVQCDEIRASVAKELISEKPERRTFIFGRAVSRVVAHELYHILTKTTGHGPGGMTKRSFTARDWPRNNSAFRTGRRNGFAGIWCRFRLGLVGANSLPVRLRAKFLDTRDPGTQRSPQNGMTAAKFHRTGPRQA
jgi:hypothetical protein